MEIWQRGWYFVPRPQLPACFGFTIVHIKLAAHVFTWLLTTAQRGRAVMSLSELSDIKELLNSDVSLLT